MMGHWQLWQQMAVSVGLAMCFEVEDFQYMRASNPKNSKTMFQLNKLINMLPADRMDSSIATVARVADLLVHVPCSLITILISEM